LPLPALGQAGVVNEIAEISTGVIRDAQIHVGLFKDDG
jgi:hypothetical protein